MLPQLDTLSPRGQESQQRRSKKVVKRLETHLVASSISPPKQSKFNLQKTNDLVSARHSVENLILQEDSYGAILSQRLPQKQMLQPPRQKTNKILPAVIVKNRYTAAGAGQSSPQKITDPGEAGYLNLRIKSSKAFPISEVGAIEDLIYRVKKIRDINEVKAQKKKQNQIIYEKSSQGMVQQSLDALNSGSDRLRSQNQTGASPQDYGQGGAEISQIDSSNMLRNSIPTTPVSNDRYQQPAKAHSYEFLKQQMRVLKKEIQTEKKMKQLVDEQDRQQFLNRQYSTSSLTSSVIQSSRNSRVGSVHQRASLILPPSQPNQQSQHKGLDGGASTSLPRISSKAHLKSQFQTAQAQMSPKGLKVIVEQAPHFHQNLVEVKNMFERKQDERQQEQLEMDRQRASINSNHPKIDEDYKSSQYRSRNTIQNTSKTFTSRKQLSKKLNLLDNNLRQSTNTASNRSLFASKQSSIITKSQTSLQGQLPKEISQKYSPYLKIQNQKEENIQTKKKQPPQQQVSQSSDILGQMFNKLTTEKQVYLASLMEVRQQEQQQIQTDGQRGSVLVKPIELGKIQHMRNTNLYKSTQDPITIMNSQRRPAEHNSQVKKPMFRYHKNLATSRYNEFLADSDDEDFFKSKPKTKDGGNYELDFKIDTYRDEIHLNKNGSQKKLISAKNSLEDRASLLSNIQSVPQNLQDHFNIDPQPAQFEQPEQFGNCNESFQNPEDPDQWIPFNEQMGPVNKTILRCGDAVFKVNYPEVKILKIITNQQVKAAKEAMIQHNKMPVYSGNVQSYLVNQILEYELISKARSVMSTEETCQTSLSPLQPYYKQLQAQTNLQFTEPAQKMLNQLKANLLATQNEINNQQHLLERNAPTTPQLELARPSQVSQESADEKNVVKKSKDHLQGVLIRKLEDSNSQKPCSRVSMGVIPLGDRFVTYGGVAATVFNDVRVFDSIDFVWHAKKPDVELFDFPGRFGHSVCAFERYLVIFGGCGPYSSKSKKRQTFQDTIFFDIETGKYCTFDGAKQSLQAEVSELKAQQRHKSLKKGNESVEGAMNARKREITIMKKRIRVVTAVHDSYPLPEESWMVLRNKAVVNEKPEARAHHAGAIFGPGLFMHGGINSDGSRTLKDWNLFDFGLQVWLNCEVSIFVDASLVTGKENQLDSSMIQMKTTTEQWDFARRYHSLTAVVESGGLSNGRELTRLMWATPLLEMKKEAKLVGGEQGMYMFGGIDHTGHQTDDLFWITMDYQENQKTINPKSGEYKGSVQPEVKLSAIKISPEGRGPIARSQHSATFFKNKFVVFGGRNDGIYPVIKNVALNDLHVFEVAANRWSALAIYGDMPASRWGHSLVANQDKIVLFGGMNLNSYCESVIYDIYIDDSHVLDYLGKPINLKKEQKFDKTISVIGNQRGSSNGIFSRYSNRNATTTGPTSQTDSQQVLPPVNIQRAKIKADLAMVTSEEGTSNTASQIQNTDRNDDKARQTDYRISATSQSRVASRENTETIQASIELEVVVRNMTGVAIPEQRTAEFFGDDIDGIGEQTDEFSRLNVAEQKQYDDITSLSNVSHIQNLLQSTNSYSDDRTVAKINQLRDSLDEHQIADKIKPAMKIVDNSFNTASP